MYTHRIQNNVSLQGPPEFQEAHAKHLEEKFLGAVVAGYYGTALSIANLPNAQKTALPVQLSILMANEPPKKTERKVWDEWKSTVQEIKDHIAAENLPDTTRPIRGDT